MKRLIVGVLGLVLMYPASCLADMTGNEWKKLTENSQIFYVAGITDAFSLSGSTAEDMSKLDKALGSFVGCLKDGMTYRQIHAMVGKYMDNHPEEWHQGMTVLTYSGMVDGCKLQK